MRIRTQNRTRSRSTGRTRSQRWKRRVIVTLVLLWLSACASAPLGPPFERAPFPPESRARLYLFRIDERPSLSTVRVTVDGREIGSFRNGEYETVELSAGSHNVRAGLRSIALVAWGWNEQRIRFAPGETLYVQLSVRLTEREQPAAAGLEIAGRPSGAASENVYIQIQPEREALAMIGGTTRLVP